MNSSKSPKYVGYFEIVFDIAYLTSLVAIGVYMMVNAQNAITYWWVAVIMILLIGDACHLLPRISFFLSKKDKYIPLINMGKQVTSITMTMFYVLLWYVGCMYLRRVNLVVAGVVIVAATIRIIMCLMPQNSWKNPSKDKFNIYRNIPFVCLGLVVAVFFAMSRQDLPQSFEWMWVAIVLSFLFYIPVVIFYRKYPMIGMLMLPKTCVYVWIVCMGINV